MLEAPLSSHLKELRSVLIKTFVSVFFGFIVVFAFSEPAISLISDTRPTSSDQEIRFKRLLNASKNNRVESLESFEIISLHRATISGRELIIEPQGYADIKFVSSPSLVLFSPLEGFLIAVKLSLWGGVILTSPIWIFALAGFILPALSLSEKRLLFPLMGLSFLFAVAGILLAYFFTIPFANKYFGDFNETLGQNLWGLEHYVDYVLTLFIAHACGGEIALIFFYLIYKGLITAKQLRGKRKEAYLSSFVLGALITPPDILSQVAAALVFIALYEAGILFATFCYKHARDHSYRSDRATLSTR